MRQSFFSALWYSTHWTHPFMFKLVRSPKSIFMTSSFQICRKITRLRHCPKCWCLKKLTDTTFRSFSLSKVASSFYLETLSPTDCAHKQSSTVELSAKATDTKPISLLVFAVRGVSVTFLSRGNCDLDTKSILSPAALVPDYINKNIVCITLHSFSVHWKRLQSHTLSHTDAQKSTHAILVNCRFTSFLIPSVHFLSTDLFLAMYRLRIYKKKEKKKIAWEKASDFKIHFKASLYTAGFFAKDRQPEQNQRNPHQSYFCKGQGQKTLQEKRNRIISF